MPQCRKLGGLKVRGVVCICSGERRRWRKRRRVGEEGGALPNPPDWRKIVRERQKERE